MTAIQLHHLKVEFDKIESYEERLKFWDERGLDFRDEYKIISGSKLVFSIQPLTSKERKAYNEWLINHWRRFYIEMKYPFDTVNEDINLVFKEFDLLKDEYNARMLSQLNKRVTMLDELRLTEQKLNTLTKTDNDKRHLNVAYLKFKSGHQFDLYMYKPTVSNRFIRLRHLGKVWDLLEYKIFLENSYSNVGKISELEFYRFKMFDELQIEKLYNFLIEKKFMHCTLDLFKEVFFGGRNQQPTKSYGLTLRRINF